MRFAAFRQNGIEGLAAAEGRGGPFRGHLEPGMHVLTKPFAMEALGSRVRAILGQA